MVCPVAIKTMGEGGWNYDSIFLLGIGWGGVMPHALKKIFDCLLPLAQLIVHRFHSRCN